MMLAREIRTREAIRALPLMMFTSDHDRDEAATARDPGIRSIQMKPVGPANYSVMGEATAEAIAEAAREATGSVPARATTTGPAGTPALHGRVLVAEDNPTNQKVVVLLLRKFGCNVDVAHNGSEAVGLCRDRAFDVILMDCQMPVMDGFEATAQIRRKGLNLPIIALTANAMDGERERCPEAGMDDYLSKPVRADELFRKLTHWMDSGAETKPGTPPETKPAHNLRAELGSFVSGLAELEIGWDAIDGLLESFLETSQTLSAGLAQAVQANDASATGTAAHSLKGSVANFGFSDLAQLAFVLETSGKAGQWAEAKRALEEFLPLCEAAREVVTEARMKGVAPGRTE